MTDFYLVWILFLVSDWPYPRILTASKPVQHEQDSRQHSKPPIQTQPVQPPHLSDPKCSPVSQRMIFALLVLPLVTFSLLFLFAHFICRFVTANCVSVFPTNYFFFFFFFREVIEGALNAAPNIWIISSVCPANPDLSLSLCFSLFPVWIICSISNSPRSY